MRGPQKIRRVEHAEKYSLGLKVQHKRKIKLPLAMESTHVLFAPSAP